MPRLLLDMDGTLAKFHDELDYLERMYEEGFFSSVAPFENMVAGVKLFMQQYPNVEVYVISSCVESPHCIKDKNKWLDQYLNIPEDHRIFPPVGSSKAAYIPGGVSKEDFLVDDYNRGLNQFLYDGGSAIKCHNNINQRGLGVYGGRAGNLWTGPMVHTDDKPEMIAAELAQWMCMEYDLTPVKEAYEIRELSPSAAISTPLDDIRALAGNKDFQSYTLKTNSGSEYRLPGHLLRDLTLNIYYDDDFKRRLADDIYGDYARSILNSFASSWCMPLVGQLDYLDNHGELDYSVQYHSQEKMEQDLKHCWDSGIKVRYSWFVDTKPLPHLKDRREAPQQTQTNINPGGSLAAKIRNAETRRTDESTLTDKSKIVR